MLLQLLLQFYFENLAHFNRNMKGDARVCLVLYCSPLGIEQGQVCIASSMYCVKGESEKTLHGSESGC